MQAGVIAYQERRFREALEQFHDLAEQGLPRAQTTLGMMYAYGEGVPQDADEALHWYRTAAAQDFGPAQFSLGILYLDGGLGLTRSKTRAVGWLKRAALNGHEGALHRLRTVDSWSYAETVEQQRTAKPKRPAPKYRASTLADLDLKLRSRAPSPPATDRSSTTEASTATRTAGTTPDAPMVAPGASNTQSKRAAAAVAAEKSGSEKRTSGGDHDNPTRLQPYSVQLLASRNEAAANAAWTRYASRHPDLFADLSPQVTRIDLTDGRGTFYRLRTSPMASRAAARTFCKALTARDDQAGCLIINPK